MPTDPTPTPLESMVATLVAERGRVIARQVIVELARRFGLPIPDPCDVERARGIAASWEQCATAARREGAALRRQAGEDASTIATARAEARLQERLAESFQVERDAARADRDALRRLAHRMSAEWADDTMRADHAENERDAARADREVLYEIGWRAVVQRDTAKTIAVDRLDRINALASEKYRADAAVEQLEAARSSASRSVEAGLEWRARAEAAEKALAHMTTARDALALALDEQGCEHVTSATTAAPEGHGREALSSFWARAWKELAKERTAYWRAALDREGKAKRAVPSARLVEHTDFDAREKARLRSGVYEREVRDPDAEGQDPELDGEDEAPKAPPVSARTVVKGGARHQKSALR